MLILYTWIGLNKIVSFNKNEQASLLSGSLMGGYFWEPGGISDTKQKSP